MTVRPSSPSALEQRDEVGALDRVGPVERLVEHEHVRVRDERRRDLRPLSHALAEPADTPVGDVEQADGVERAIDCRVVAHAVQVRDVADELASGEHRWHGLVLGHERERALDFSVGAGVRAEHTDHAGVRSEQPGHRPHERRLAGAVGPEQTGDAGPERAAQLGERDLRTEPHRHVADFDRRVGSEGGIRSAHASGCR